MPKLSKEKTAYMKDYQAQPQEVRKNTLRRAAQRAAIKAGTQAIGDGEDIAHKKALDNGGSNGKGNTKIQSAAKNRAWRKGESGYKVPNTK